MFKPYELVYLRGADDKVMQLVECISCPWEENGKLRIKIRLTPGDPGTLGETNVDNLIQLPKIVECKRHLGRFEIVTQAIKPYPVKKGFTLSWDCPTCGRRYFLTTDLSKKEWDADGEIGEWWSDRKLEVTY